MPREEWPFGQGKKVDAGDIAAQAIEAEPIIGPITPQEAAWDLGSDRNLRRTVTGYRATARASGDWSKKEKLQRTNDVCSFRTSAALTPHIPVSRSQDGERATKRREEQQSWQDESRDDALQTIKDEL